MRQVTDENYEDLANAIIERALKDLERAYRKLKRTSGSVKRKHIAREILVIEKQLRSDWCVSLTGVDMEFLIERVSAKWKRKNT